MSDGIVQRRKVNKSSSNTLALPHIYVSPHLDKRIVDILTESKSIVTMEMHTFVEKLLP